MSSYDEPRTGYKIYTVIAQVFTQIMEMCKEEWAAQFEDEEEAEEEEEGDNEDGALEDYQTCL